LQTLSDIKSATSQLGIDLSAPENLWTVWFENGNRKLKYSFFRRATSLEHAKLLAGRNDAIILTRETGRVQIIVWRDGEWSDGYAEEDDDVFVRY
jgi:hypothetical protein